MQGLPLESKMYVVILIVTLTVVSVNCQADCPAFNVSELGAMDMLTQGGLVGSAFAAVSGDLLPVSVQVHNSNIVCLRSGQTRDTYSGVSVVVTYTCSGAPSECSGNPILSQFEFECVANPVRWAPSVDGNASNIITTPPAGNLSTTPRTDCGVCISPLRSVFAANEQHCGCKWRVNNEYRYIYVCAPMPSCVSRWKFGHTDEIAKRGRTVTHLSRSRVSERSEGACSDADTQVFLSPLSCRLSVY